MKYDITVIIPTLDPGEKICAVADQLNGAGFGSARWEIALCSPFFICRIKLFYLKNEFVQRFFIFARRYSVMFFESF